MLILSFVHSMVWIVPGIFYLTLRNAVPLFDFENRK
jgi:surface polysaccharide O-acyltransferase-like enzyme